MTFDPRLRRTDVMLNSIHSCISNASKKLAWAPEMSFSKILSQPRMFLQKSKSRNSFKQLESSANTHGWRQLNKQMEMVNSNVNLINLTAILNGCLFDKPFTINPDSIKFEGVFSIFGFPDKMESILSERVFPTFQIHFFSPSNQARNIVLTKFVNLVHEGNFYPFYTNQLTELNTTEDGNSSLCFKAEVSLP